VARQRLGMGSAGDDLAVDQHAVAVENDEVKVHVDRGLRDQTLSSSSGTQYSSSR
jgi:hypothetical protein